MKLATYLDAGVARLALLDGDDLVDLGDDKGAPRRPAHMAWQRRIRIAAPAA